MINGSAKERQQYWRDKIREDNEWQSALETTIPKIDFETTEKKYVKKVSKVQISFAEKPILNYLREGGNIVSTDGINLVANFVMQALKDDDVLKATITYNLSAKELCLVFVTMQAINPHACLDMGGPLLVPTLVFMEPFRLESIGRLVEKYQEEGYDRESAITQASSDISKVIFSTHQQAGKTMCFEHLKQVTQKRDNVFSWVIGLGSIILVALLLKSCK